MAFLGKRKSAMAPAPKDTKPKQSSQPGVFFGVLRSEFDTPDALPDAFSQAKEAFDELLSAYRNGRIGPEQAGVALSRMILTDRNGLQWTAGATTGRWYRRLPGGAWSSALPPASDDEELRRTSKKAVAAAGAALSAYPGEAVAEPDELPETMFKDEDAPVNYGQLPD